MKRLLLTLLILLPATPAFAQETIDLGGFLLDLPAPTGPRGAPAARGAAPAPPRGAAPNAPPVDRLVRLRELLAKANNPLAKEQEMALNALLEAEIPNMRRALQARILELQKMKAGAGPAVTPGAPPPPPAMPAPEEVAPHINRLNDQLLAKIGEAPTLTLDQKTVVKKLYRDQIFARRGFDALKLTMDEAGVPFTPEQSALIEPLFNEQNKARAKLTDKAEIDKLERDTLAQVLKLLAPPQRAALAKRN